MMPDRRAAAVRARVYTQTGPVGFEGRSQAWPG